MSRGCYTRTAPTKVQITELPIGMWTEDFKMQLEEMLEKHSNVLKSFDNQYTDQDVAFTLVFSRPSLVNLYSPSSSFPACARSWHLAHKQMRFDSLFVFF